MTIHDYVYRQRPATVRFDVTVTRAPGRGERWSAEVGTPYRSPWCADGATEKAAVDTLTARLQAFITQYQRPYVVAFRGYTAVVALDIGRDPENVLTFTERVIGPDGRESSCGCKFAGWDVAQASARYGLAQRTTDWHDDASVHEAAAFLAKGPKWSRDSLCRYSADDLYEYAAWQRAARAAMTAKLADWHEWASAHQGEFALPRPATA